MLKRLLHFFIILFVCNIQAQQTAMSASEITNFRQKVKIASESTKTILSDFTQFKHLSFLSNDIKTTGKMAFKAPNLIKWEYIDPFKYSVIFKEDKLLINDEGKKSDVKIGSSKLFKKLNQLIVNSVSGNMFDSNEFDIEYHKTAIYTIIAFNSKDRELSKYIKQFVLHFDTINANVIEVKMIEPSDDFTRIIFKNRRENTILKDAIFTN